MKYWLVRAGRHGEQEEEIFEQNVTAIGWEELPDLSEFKTREELKAKYIETYGDAKPKAITLRIGQLWKFANEIKVGDLIVTPNKSSPVVAIGEVKGEYEYKEDSPNAKHRRAIEWKITAIPRSEFPLEILRAIGVQLAVSTIINENTKQYIKNMLAGKQVDSNDNEIKELEEIDLEEYSKDTIIKFLEKKFQRQDLARLINGILIAKGYSTQLSPPGPDGGVDIFASSGQLGFDDPKICIQVKSSKTPADVRILRELGGVSKKFGADYGILVAWGGLNKAAIKENKGSFFTTKLWDQGKIVDELIKSYDKLDSELKSKIPLKKIWAVIEE